MKALPILGLVLAAGCAVGPSVNRLPVATDPAGATITIRYARGEVSGELLEASDSAFLTRTAAELVRVNYSTVRDVRLPVGGSGAIRGAPSARQLERWRSLSRFPAGVPADAFRELLALHGQTEPRVIR
jgi:hypothetical protein